MSSSPRLAAAAAKVLAEEHPTDSTPPSPESRARALAAIRGALVERRRSRRVRPLLFAVSGLAAAVAAAPVLSATVGAKDERSVATTRTTETVDPNVVTAAEVHGSVFLVRGESRAPAETREPIAPQDRVVTSDGYGALALRGGSRVEIEPRGEYAVTDDGRVQTVRVEGGAVTARVSKLSSGQRFLVVTPDAEVEVRGTVFRVARGKDPACGSVTRVHVTEGRVAVRAHETERVLGAGDDWASPCVAKEAPAQPAEAAPAKPPSPPARHAPSSAEAPAKAPPSALEEPSPAAPVDSELAAQNALYRDAMAAKARGDRGGAVRALETMLVRYPNTPLREAALAQRMKLLSDTDRPRAVKAASEYLREFPNGFAQADARALAQAP
jgi:ferric-dicitrate binding protein FerR (iron transport regulator)